MNNSFSSPSRQELHDLLDNLPSMVSIFNKDLIYEFCNKTFLQKTEKSSEEVIGKHLQDVCPDTFDILKNHLNTLLDGKEVTFQEKFTRKNKKLIADGKFTPRYDKNGKVNGFFSYTKDVTKEKKLESQLLKSENRLNLVQSLAKIGGWYYNFETEKVWCSKGVYDIFQIKEEEALSLEKIISFLPKEDQERHAFHWNESIKNKTDFNIKHKIINGEQNILARCVATFFYKDDQPLYATGAIIDITETERIQQKLKKSEERYQLAITGTNAGVWDWDISTGKVIYHRECATILGYTPEEFSLQRIEDWLKYFHLGDLAQSTRLLQEHFDGESEFYEDEARMKHKNGNWVWVEYRGKVSSRTEDGKPLRISGILIDITTRKNAVIELNSYKENLKELVKEQTKELKTINKELEAFAYSISHDLRTPLRYIEGFSKLLRRKITIDNDEAAQYFDHISEGVQTMSKMIEALLNFSRLGKRAIQKEMIDTNKMVDEAIKDFIHITQGRNIKWKIGELPNILGDPSLLLMVFENLISNAIKFTKNTPTPIIEIKALKIPDQKRKTTIYIKDNGAGFNMEYAKKLFGVFQRLHTQKEFEGTGIGLANVKKIIDKHGGSIRVEAEEDRGATFYITL